MRASILVVTLICTGCVAMPAPVVPVQVLQAPPPEAAAPPICRDVETRVMIDGAEQTAQGRACQQPDGTWRLTGITDQAPPATLVAPPVHYYPPYPGYYAAEPWYYAPPVVSGSIVIGGGWRSGYHHGWRGRGR